MIKILFFIETLSGGGAEKVLRTLVNNMDHTRFDITVMTVFPDESSKLLAPQVHYGSLYCKRNFVTHWKYRLEAALGLCCRLHIRQKFDMEVAYLERGSTKVIASSPNKNSVKIAWVHCDLLEKNGDREAFVKKAAPWYKKFQKVVCVSENVRQSFLALFGNQSETEVLYNVYDEDEIVNKTLLYPQQEKRRTTVMTAGRLSREKGYDRLLKAHRRLLDDGLSHDLWILGDGPDRGLLTSLIETLGIGDTVRLLGFQENPYPYFQAADLAVCSSHYEGFSTFITETLILGKPVVTTDCTGMRELLGNGEYGLITENTEQGIYEGLKKLLENQVLRDEYAVKAAQRGKSFRKKDLVRETQRFFERELNRI